MEMGQWGELMKGGGQTMHVSPLQLLLLVFPTCFQPTGKDLHLYSFSRAEEELVVPFGDFQSGLLRRTVGRLKLPLCVLSCEMEMNAGADAEFLS
jgi:hypothetical protein